MPTRRGVGTGDLVPIGVAEGAGVLATGVGVGVTTGLGDGATVGAIVGEGVTSRVGLGLVGGGVPLAGGGGGGAGAPVGAAVAAGGGGAAPPEGGWSAGGCVGREAGTGVVVPPDARGAGAALVAALGSGVVGEPRICGNGKPGWPDGWTRWVSVCTNTRASAVAIGCCARTTTAASVPRTSAPHAAAATAGRLLPKRGRRERICRTSVASAIARISAIPVRIAAGEPAQIPIATAPSPQSAPTKATAIHSCRDTC